MSRLYIDLCERNDASRRRHSREGHVNSFASRLYVTHWTRNAVWFDLNTRAFDLNASAFDRNAIAFGLYSLARRRCSLQIKLAR